MTTASPTVRAELGEIVKTLSVLLEVGRVYELRALDVPNGKWSQTHAGYFDDPDEMAREAARLSNAGAKGVYLTVNPVLPQLLARASNRVIIAKRGEATGDNSILRRRRFFLDFDPVRPSGISATEDEKRAAFERARLVAKALGEIGWPRPAAADSGNGAHLVYAVDLPSDDGGLVQQALEGIAFRYGDDRVAIDTKVGNAARICKLYGTAGRKGDSTPDRPHRLSRLAYIPPSLVAVTEEQLRAVAVWRPRHESKQSRNGTSYFSIDDWIRRYGLEVRGPYAWMGGRKWIMPTCPWNPEHTNGAGYLVEHASGALAAGCHHNSCQGKGWKELRELFEPDAYERRNERRHHKHEPHRAAGRDEQPDESQAVGICIADVVPERVEWLWTGRIPRGKPTILDGDPGLGKSTLTLEIAARTSRGEPLPGDTGRCSPAGVVILSAEDGLADTIRTRLEAAGADLTRVHAIPTVPTLGGDDILPELPRDLPVIARKAREIGATLVIIDPLMAYLSAETSANRDQDIRRALAPLARMADETGVAVVVVRHLNKRSDGNPLYRGGGSIGIIGAARSGLLVAKDPEDEDRRVLAITKANLAKDPGALSFRLVEAANGVPRIQWLGSSSHSARTLMAEPQNDEDRGATDNAIYVLREILGDGPVDSKEARKQAQAAGVADRTLDRAKSRLGVRARKMGFGKGWEWILPQKQDLEERQAEDLGALREDDAFRAEKNEKHIQERQDAPKSAKAELGGLPPELIGATATALAILGGKIVEVSPTPADAIAEQKAGRR